MTADAAEGAGAPHSLSLTLGGPTFRLEKRLRLEPPFRVVRLLLVGGIVFWAVPVLVALIEVLAHHSAAASLLTMMGFHTRALLGVPLLIAADLILEKRVSAITRRIVAFGIVGNDDIPKWDRLITRLQRWRDKVIPEAVPLVLAALVVIVGIRHLLPTELLPWLMPLFHGAADGATRSVSWWSYVIVVQPIFLFLLLRFFWHWFLWGVALTGLARMRLHLQANHGDRAGGIAFFSDALEAFNVAILAGSIVLATTWIDEFIGTGADAAMFAPHFLGMVAIAFLLPLTPYLPLSLHMLQSRREGAAAYGQFMRQYTRGFDAKWINRQELPADFLGSSDVQSLADVGNAVRFIDEMRGTVFSFAAIVRLFAVSVGPVVPLVLARMPAVDIARRIFGVVF